VPSNDNFWRLEPSPSGVWQWDIDDGYLDCRDGCDCHRVYRFYSYPDGEVDLVVYDEQGPPGQCDFSAVE
jgi:hypothetical protein